jgi:LuxR family transcriptional regulator of csgAB operon
MSIDADNWLIYILSPRKMQNELLAAFLRKETGIVARIESRDEFSCPDVDWPGKIMLFCDCQTKQYPDLLALVAAANLVEHPNFYPLLFNVMEKISVGDELVSLGVRGLFYDDEPLENLVRGIEAVRQGEIWLPRQLLSSCLASLRRREKLENIEKSNEPKATLLSFREREVLQMVIAGYTNDDIAEKLGLSPHTIRSHLYRIFRKIKVKSRQQAAAWAVKNM